MLTQELGALQTAQGRRRCSPQLHRRGDTGKTPVSAGGTLKPLPFRDTHFSGHHHHGECPSLPSGHPPEGSSSHKLLSCGAKVRRSWMKTAEPLQESPALRDPSSAGEAGGNLPGRSPRTAGLRADLNSAAAAAAKRLLLLAMHKRAAPILPALTPLAAFVCIISTAALYEAFHGTDRASPQSSRSKYKTRAPGMHRTGGHKER